MTEVGGDYREGFLCPICMKDLGTIGQLTDHFEKDHANEDKDVLNQLKGLFGKAKKKFLKKEEKQYGEDAEILSRSVETYSPGGIDPTLWEPQQLGATRTHTENFRRVRDARIDRYAVETNKLLIRLDKLIGPDLPKDPGKRKAYEKKLVNWAPDADMNLCTTCGKKFSFTRRHHHCRLCGTVMCHKCSQFLPFTYAAKLTNPAIKRDIEPYGFLRRAGSNSSLNSVMNSDGEPHLRTCIECRKLLERRDQLVEQRQSKLFVVQLYEKLRVDIEGAEQYLPTYSTMTESLNAGETTYPLHEAQAMKNKIGRLYENIDRTSKRIAGLGITDSMEEPPPQRQLQLQATIRKMASLFLQENLLGLQPLPTEEKLKQLQDARQAEIQRQIAQERQRAMVVQEREREREKKRTDEGKWKDDLMNNFKALKIGNDSEPRPLLAVPNKGWLPSVETNTVDLSNTDDPLVQQIIIIKNYIKQAEDAMKLDEVSMLRQNLVDLEKEYTRQQSQGLITSPSTKTSSNTNPFDEVETSSNPFHDDYNSKNPFE